VLDPDYSLPAAGQGAMAIEIKSERTDGVDLFALLAPLNHLATSQAVTAERKVSKIFGGSCQIPLAAFATVDGGQMRLRAMVATPDGARMASADVHGAADAPEQLGEAVAELLREQDAAAILASCAVTPDQHEGLAPHA
jgi:hydroxymethylbilane synthase